MDEKKPTSATWAKKRENPERNRGFKRGKVMEKLELEVSVENHFCKYNVEIKGNEEKTRRGGRRMSRR